MPQALAGPANAVNPAHETPPWMQDGPRPRAGAARRDRPVEGVHWSVVALTVFTAMSVLIGAYGGNAAPRELLPIVIVAPLR